MKVAALEDPRQSAGALKRDPVGAAYLLADLQEPYFEHTRWFGAISSQGEIRTVLMLYTALKTPALLTFGEEDGIVEIVKQKEAELPPACTAMIWPGHEQSIEKIYYPSNKRRMIRMGLGRDDFRPCDTGMGAEPLRENDLPDLLKLMEHYPGNYFEEAMFRDGLYFGIRVEGKLVSAGGVHTVSPDHGVAAIGNIVTHTRSRRNGFASACTSVLIGSLFDQVENIALNVEASNTAAVQCYKRLGFSSHLSYNEAFYRKRNPR